MMTVLALSSSFVLDRKFVVLHRWRIYFAVGILRDSHWEDRIASSFSLEITLVLVPKETQLNFFLYDSQQRSGGRWMADMISYES